MSATAELVGRDAELAELLALVHDARAGHGHVVLLGGEPGVGKTALAESLAAAVAGTGVQTVWGQCWEGGAAASFWPWVQVLRTCISGADGSSLVRQLGPGAADLAPLLPELASRIPGLVPTAVSDSQEARLRLFDAVGTYLTQVAADSGGIVVALEDLHSADEASLQLLRALARSVFEHGLLLLGTYRESEVAASPTHAPLLSAVARQGRVIRLSGLDEGGVSALLGRAGAIADEGVVRSVRETTDGNPFLVYEAARLLRGEGRKSNEVGLPTDAKMLINQRLAPLPDALRRTLRFAAVLGREFELASLGKLANRSPHDLLDEMTTAAGLAIVTERALARWSFSHSILRETLAEELAGEERADAHRRAADAIEQFPPFEGDPIVQVAYHLFEAGDRRAVDACAGAALAAMHTFAYEEAAHWYERALAVLEHCHDGDERRRYDLLVALGDATLRAGDASGAKAIYYRAFNSARALGSVELLAEAAVPIAYAFPADAMIISALDDVLVELPEVDTPLRTKVLISFARVLMPSSVGFDVLRNISRQAVEMARRLADPETLWYVLLQWHQISVVDFTAAQEQLGVGDELVSLAQASGDRERVMRARRARAAGLYFAGAVREAEVEVARAVRDAEELRLPFEQWVTKMHATPVMLARGRLEDAERLSREAREALRLGDFPAVDPCFHAQLLSIRRQQGRFEEVKQLARTALERWPAGMVDCVRHFALVRALGATGRLDEARAQFEAQLSSGWGGQRLIDMLAKPLSERTAMAPCCRAGLAELSSLLDDRRLAEPLYASLLPYPDLHIFEVHLDSGASMGVAAKYLGQLATLLGRYREAETHFEAARRLHERGGARVWSAHGAVEYAQMLLLRQGERDRERAIGQLRSAGEEFRAIGMTFYADRADALMAPLPSALEIARLRQEGERWSLEFRGRVVQLRDSTGIQYLAVLLRNPGRNFTPTELAGQSTDPEHARQRVSRSVKGAIDRLAKADADLGAHLRSRVRTGVVSSYVPDPRAPVRWEE